MKTCKACGHKLTNEWLRARKESRGRNVSAGLLKRQAEGKAIGRPVVIHTDKDEYVALRNKGMSLRAIAKEMKCSHRTVLRKLRA